MGFAESTSPGIARERVRSLDPLRFVARAGRVLDAVDPERNIARVTACLFVPKFATACRVELEGDEVSAHLDDRGEVRVVAGHAVTTERGSDDVFEAGKLRSQRTSSVLSVPIPGEPSGKLTLVLGRSLGREDLAVVRDVARRLGAALERRRLAEQARVAKRRQSELLRHASHELRTPLASLSLLLSGLLRSARNGKLEADAIIGRLERADAQLGRVLGLIAQLLDEPRVDPSALELTRSETDLGAVVREVAERFRANAASQGRSPVVRVHAERPVVGRWDRELLVRALSNVASFALGSGSSGELELGARRSRGGAYCFVRAPGWRVDAADQAELLRARPDPTRPDRLGLWIARRIVEAHGGRARVRSVAGKGAELVLFLPVGEA